jgi:hypothetical protein
MQVKNSRYISEILYNAYQRDPNLKMDEASFREIVKSVTGGNCFSSPGSQLLLDYEDWKKTQPPRQLPGSKGMTEENIAYLKENYSGRLTMFGKIDALDTMVEMGILTEKEKMEAVMGPIELVAISKEKIICTGPVRAVKYMPEWDSFFTGAAIMQSDSLEDLFKLLDEQLKNSREKDAAQEIKDVLEQVARKSFGAAWGVV